MPEFDPYYTWLGIRPSERPVNHYRLLGIANFESAPEVIENAADRTTSFLRTKATGPYAAESQAILNEVATAVGVLLDERLKAAYDQELRRVDAAGSAVAPVAPPPQLATASTPDAPSGAQQPEFKAKHNIGAVEIVGSGCFAACFLATLTAFLLGGPVYFLFPFALAAAVLVVGLGTLAVRRYLNA